jgi:hypothetical protein
MTDENLNAGADAGKTGGDAAAIAAAAAKPAEGTGAATGAAATIVDPKAAAAADAGAPKTPADWPADWRDKLAGADKDLLKQLGTLGSPQDLFKSYREMQKKLSSGEYKKATQAPGKDATPEQIAEYRKENGIPDKPEAYDTTLDNGLVIGAQDKPIVDAFLKEMHAANAPNAVVKSALNAYFKIAEDQRANMSNRDNEVYDGAAEALRKEWGPEFKRNQNAIAAYVETLPEGFRDNLIGARLADGSKLLGNPEGIKFIYNLAKESNPAITVVPGSANPGKTIEEEIKALNVGSDEYWKSSDKQARYRELLQAQEGLKKKRA